MGIAAGEQQAAAAAAAAAEVPLLSPPPPPIYGVPIPDPYHQQPYIVLPVYRRRRRRRCSACCAALSSSSTSLLFALAVCLLALAAFFLFPSDPDLRISRVRLHHLHVSTDSIDVSLGLDLVVNNRDFFSLDYRSIQVSIGYRGHRLGSATSAGGGHIRARGVSYVGAELKIDGVRVIDDIFYLIEDLARGSIPFDTVTEVQGQLNLFFLDVPIQGRISCAVHVNPGNQTVVHQDCYPE